MHWFLPINNSLPYLNEFLQPVGIAPHHNLGKRLVDVVANGSRVCTSERHIIEQSFARVYNQALSGNQKPVPHQLMLASHVQPTPDLPSIGIYLDVMAVLRRFSKPYTLKYPLVPGVSYADHGRDLRFRLTKENVLCSTKGLGFLRRDIFAAVTPRELNTGAVRLANLLDQTQTELPTMTEAGLMGMTLGPYSVNLSHSYVTAIHEEDVRILQNLGHYQSPAQYHQDASQVCCQAQPSSTL